MGAWGLQKSSKDIQLINNSCADFGNTLASKHMTVAEPHLPPTPHDVVIIVFAVVVGQPDPWPPLVSTCDVMPLVAADANKYAHDLVACASSSWPNCETINCQILSNDEQFEMELLPCWQHPAMWIKNRNIAGNITYQDIFASSRTAKALIGGQQVELNVTVVQRNLTLGFGVSD